MNRTIAAAAFAALAAVVGCAPKPVVRPGAPKYSAEVMKLPPLSRAAETNDLEALKALLAKRNAQPDALDEQGLTALARASYQGHRGAALALLDAGASTAARAKDGGTPLHYAASTGKTETIELLLSRGAAVDAGDAEGVTPLGWASYQGRKDAAEMLLSRGADPNALAKDRTTALHRAAMGGSVEVVELLLRRGAKLEAPDDGGATPATLGVLAKRWDAVEALGRAGASIPYDLGKVGLGLKADAAGILVSQVDAAAQRAGIAVGDRLVELEGAPTAGLTVPQVIARVRGPAGGTVRLAMRRGERTIPFTIVRDPLWPADRKPVTAVAAAPQPQAPAAPRGLPPSPAPGPFRAPDESKFALVVGIERYDTLPDASFAARDARAVRAHLEALGVPPRNLVYLENQKAGRSALEKYLEEWLPRNARAGGEVYFYFSGHGAPDPVSGEAYLVPWDGDPSYLKSTALPLKKVYAALAKLPGRSVVALDACFSGAGGRSVLAKGARPLVAKHEAVEAPEGLTVLAAASGDEISGALDEQGHGAFTYFLLKGLSEGKRGAKELHEYLKPRVQDEARRQNREQTPVLMGADTEL